MPYANRELLNSALSALDKHYSPLLLVSLPCMLSHGIPMCETGKEAQSSGIEFGSTNEREWLEQYFRVVGAPADKPFYMPGTNEWVQSRYADRSLQRRRKDFESTVFHHPARTQWALREGASDALASGPNAGKDPVPLWALMVWMWRNRDLSSVDDALSAFIVEYGFNRNGFIGNVYSDEVPSNVNEIGLADEPLSTDELAELVGAVRPPPPVPAIEDLINVLHSRTDAKDLILSQGLIDRIVAGWLVNDIVVLVGPTGSGKTTLARALADGLSDALGGDRSFSAFLEVSPDFDITQVIGYENLAGEYASGQFADEVLFVGEPSDPRVVIMDEWNLAQIDSYFAPVLSAVESDMSLPLPGRVRLEELDQGRRKQMKLAQPDVSDGRWRLPEDTLFIATCNSWAEEPETRLPISGPVKRRCRIIRMPNALEEHLARDGRAGLVEACNKLLQREASLVEQRRDSSRESMFDKHRRERLKTVQTINDLPDEVANSLLTITRILLESVQTKNSFTLGILRDVLLSCVYAREGQQGLALGQQVTDKLLHQLQGDPHILQVVQDAAVDLPNSSEIAETIEQMGGLAGEHRIRPLV